MSAAKAGRCVAEGCLQLENDWTRMQKVSKTEKLEKAVRMLNLLNWSFVLILRLQASLGA